MQRSRQDTSPDLRQNFRNITKREIGLAFLILGLLAFIGLLALDVIRHKLAGIGPAQLMALAACLGMAFLGATLILAGERPA